MTPGSAGVPPAQDLAGSWRLVSQGWPVNPPTGAGEAPLQECGRDARAPGGKPMASQVQIRPEPADHYLCHPNVMPVSEFCKRLFLIKRRSRASTSPCWRAWRDLGKPRLATKAASPWKRRREPAVVVSPTTLSRSGGALITGSRNALPPQEDTGQAPPTDPSSPDLPTPGHPPPGPPA